MLEAGVMAPDFDLIDQDGIKRSLRDTRGSWTVLYFYPKDDTPGCSAEACSFRDALPGFEGLDAVVYGVSADDQISHRQFADKFDLNFPLLVDSDRGVIDAYQAYGDKQVGDVVKEGILRRTYLIDPEGRVARAWEVDQPETHAAEVRRAISELA